MGRSSSTGYPFLVQRNDAGQFTYHRDIPVALAPLVIGEVTLPWSGRNRMLAGKATIKISLASGDDRTAKQRWGVVHPQVEALVQMAELLVGHAQTDVTSEYSRTDRYLHELGDLNDEIQRITFKTLDVKGLVGLMPWRLAV